MKRIIVRSRVLASLMKNTELSASEDAWWESKSKEFKEKYIKAHPHSKYAKNAAKKAADDKSPGKSPKRTPAKPTGTPAGKSYVTGDMDTDDIVNHFSKLLKGTDIKIKKLNTGSDTEGFTFEGKKYYVDSNEDMLKQLKKLLKAKGHTLAIRGTGSASGKEADFKIIFTKGGGDTSPSGSITKGLLKWVDDYKEMRKNGNVKGAKEIKAKIDAMIKKENLDSKEVFGKDPDEKKKGMSPAKFFSSPEEKEKLRKAQEAAKKDSKSIVDSAKKKSSGTT